MRSISAAASTRRSSPAPQSIYWLVCLVIVLTCTLSQVSLNLVMNYTVTGGSFFEKFHPATYLAIPLVVFIIADSMTRPLPLDRYLLSFIGAMALLMAFLALRDRGAYASVIVDVRIVPTIALLALSRLSTMQVRKICALFVGIAFFDGLFVILDYLLGRHIFPAASVLNSDIFFRPTGFSGHPIQASWLLFCGLFLTLLGAPKSSLLRPLMLFFLLCIALTQQRAALGMACALVIYNFFRPFTPRGSKWDYYVDISVVIAMPILIVAAYFGGVFDRLLGIGVWEQSSQSRFLIYDTLRYMSRDQLMLGLDPGVSDSLARQAVNDEYVESSFILAVFGGGLPFAIIYILVNIVFFWRFISVRLIFALPCLLAILLSLEFMTKGVVPMSLSLVGYFLWRRRQQRQPLRASSWPRLAAAPNNATA